MSRMGNYRLGLEETDDYRKGWEEAETGGPFPQWKEGMDPEVNLTAMRLGWQDHHEQRGGV